MAKRKGLSYEEKLLNALSKIPVPIVDNKHRILIYFVDDRARSNETRFEHIVSFRHELKPTDFTRIQKEINNSFLKKDKERKSSFDLYIKRNNYGMEYIKLSLELDFSMGNKAYVKTMFITKNLK